jgi:hypothetical protein
MERATVIETAALSGYVRILRWRRTALTNTALKKLTIEKDKAQNSGPGPGGMPSQAATAVATASMLTVVTAQ